MTDNVPSTDSSPPEAKPPSRLARVCTSWKLWTFALIVAVAVIGVTLTIPIVQRYRAITYFRQLDNQRSGHIELAEGAEIWAQRFGKWGRGLQQVRHVSSIKANDETMAHVSTLREITLLSLRPYPDEAITEEGAALLTGFNQLDGLHLSCEAFTDEVLSRLLAERPPLTTLNLRYTGAGQRTLEELSNITSIRHLFLLPQKFDDSVYGELAPLTNLHWYVGSGMGDQGVEWLTQSPELEFVVLLDSTITDAALESLCEQKGLRWLSVTSPNVTAEGLSSLENLPQLERLGILECPHLTAHDIAQLPDLPQLRRLAISPDLLTTESIARLRQYPALERMYVLGRGVDPQIRTIIESEWQASFENALSETPRNAWISGSTWPWD